MVLPTRYVIVTFPHSIVDCHASQQSIYIILESTSRQQPEDHVNQAFALIAHHPFSLHIHQPRLHSAYRDQPPQKSNPIELQKKKKTALCSLKIAPNELTACAKKPPFNPLFNPPSVPSTVWNPRSLTQHAPTHIQTPPRRRALPSNLGGLH